DAPAPVAAAPAAAEQTGNADLNEALSIAKRDMGDLWDRAYSCLAASIRLRHKVNQLLAKVGEVKVEGDDEATMRRAADISNQLRDEFDQIKASDDVSKVQKAVSYIKSKGDKTVLQTINRIKVALLKIERAKKAAEEAERARKAAEEAERRKKETIESDNKRINEKFDALAESGVFRQLNWTGAVRQLESMRDEFKYSESQIVADGVILKVKMMARVQEVFVANCKGYTFGKFKLARCKIVDISESEIKLVKPDGKTPMKMNWTRFYQTYHGNLNELIIKFIEKGKDTSRLKDGKRLSLQPWAEAMMGAALTMRLICSDGAGADVRAVQIAQNAVKAYPDYLNHAKEIFPDVEFDVSAAE
ncbi:MAG: hypothetical protein IJ829_02860, partial [Kiritimatiellae bacterium]|nr:hypothetical protein [Kiritimatiellia bacterium]